MSTCLGREWQTTSGYVIIATSGVTCFVGSVAFGYVCFILVTLSCVASWARPLYENPLNLKPVLCRFLYEALHEIAGSRQQQWASCYHVSFAALRRASSLPIQASRCGHPRSQVEPSPILCRGFCGLDYASTAVGNETEQPKHQEQEIQHVVMLIR